MTWSAGWGMKMQLVNLMLYPKYSAKAPPVFPIKVSESVGESWAGLPVIWGRENLGLLEGLNLQISGATRGAEGALGATSASGED